MVSNKNAPINTVAYLNPYTGGQEASPGTSTIPAGTPLPGTPEYVVYNSDGFNGDTSTYPTGVYSPGTPINPANTHWIINNQAYALSVNNPYPGWSRSLLRGQPYSDFDATVMKTFPITERVNLQLSMAAYNVLNQQFRGVGNAFVGASNFTSNAENASGSRTRLELGQSIRDSWGQVVSKLLFSRIESKASSHAGAIVQFLVEWRRSKMRLTAARAPHGRAHRLKN